MERRRTLGQGLAALLPGVAPRQTDERVHELPLDSIRPNPYQPRREFGAAELAELAASIKAQGLLQPIVVREVAPDSYELIAGERRLRATRDLGQTTIRALVRTVDDHQLLELALIENLIRADLNDIEVAEALLQLQNKYAYTTTQLAEVIGKSRPAVSNTLRLLELPTEVQEQIRRGHLTAGHGRAVLSFAPEQRLPVAEQATREGWSVRELEQRALADSTRRPVKRPRPRSNVIPSAPPQLKRAEQQLMERMGTRVRITEQAGVGTIQLSYHGAEDLTRLLGLLLAGSNPV
jgi:ParB family chromosome partitioning protein